MCVGLHHGMGCVRLATLRLFHLFYILITFLIASVLLYMYSELIEGYHNIGASWSVGMKVWNGRRYVDERFVSLYKRSKLSGVRVRSFLIVWIVYGVVRSKRNNSVQSVDGVFYYHN